MFPAELKTKLRSLKKLERRIRGRYLTLHPQVPLIWEAYFSTAGVNRRPASKYPIEILTRFDRNARKHVFEEYLYTVFLQHAKEEGMTLTLLLDPEILSFFDLPPYASLTDVKIRFRELAHQYHPDKGGDHEKMIELIEMYEKCCPKKR